MKTLVAVYGARETVDFLLGYQLSWAGTGLKRALAKSTWTA